MPVEIGIESNYGLPFAEETSSGVKSEISLVYVRRMWSVPELLVLI